MTYLRAMVWTCLSLLLFPLLVACTQHPSISEADTYLQVQAEKAQLEALRKQLQSSRDRLTAIPPQLLSLPSEMPPSQLGSLASWLLENDCTKKSTQEDKDLCYRITRVVLISTTRALDDSNALAYAGQRTAKQLADNINVLIDSLAPPEDR
ncbi:hypothetical protein D3C81_479460 [compost metagenome]